MPRAVFQPNIVALARLLPFLHENISLASPLMRDLIPLWRRCPLNTSGREPLISSEKARASEETNKEKERRGR